MPTALNSRAITLLTSLAVPAWSQGRPTIPTARLTLASGAPVGVRGLALAIPYGWIGDTAGPLGGPPLAWRWPRVFLPRPWRPPGVPPATPGL